MQRSILVPLDGSSLSEQSLPIACDLARRSGATLHVVHVHGRYVPDPIYVEGLPVMDEAMHSLGKDHERAYLDAIRTRLLAEADQEITIAVLDPLELENSNQTVSVIIAAYAATHDAALIVMTTHGRGGLERLWLGSVADEVVRTSVVPVLLIRPDDDAQLTSVAPIFRRMLIPLDGSALAEQIVEPACTLGKLTGAEYTLLHVVETPTRGLATMFQELYTDRTHEQQVQARAYLEQVAGRLRNAGLTVDTYVRVADHVANAILDMAHADRMDLIAIATHGRSGLPRLVLGSLADKLVRSTHVPMFVYRPQLAADQDVSELQSEEIA